MTCSRAHAATQAHTHTHKHTHAPLADAPGARAGCGTGPAPRTPPPPASASACAGPRTGGSPHRCACMRACVGVWCARILVLGGWEEAALVLCRRGCCMRERVCAHMRNPGLGVQAGVWGPAVQVVGKHPRFHPRCTLHKNEGGHTHRLGQTKRRRTQLRWALSPPTPAELPHPPPRARVDGQGALLALVPVPQRVIHPVLLGTLLPPPLLLLLLRLLAGWGLLIGWLPVHGGHDLERVARGQQRHVLRGRAGRAAHLQRAPRSQRQAWPAVPACTRRRGPAAHVGRWCGLLLLCCVCLPAQGGVALLRTWAGGAGCSCCAVCACLHLGAWVARANLAGALLSGRLGKSA